MTLVAWAVLGLTLVYQTWGQGAIRGLPCIERLNQLHCLDRGDSYPESRIESFIDLNKALTRRMFGEFQPPGYFFDQVPTFPNIQNFETVDFPEHLRPADVRTGRDEPAQTGAPARWDGGTRRRTRTRANTTRANTERASTARARASAARVRANAARANVTKQTMTNVRPTRVATRPPAQGLATPTPSRPPFYNNVFLNQGAQLEVAASQSALGGLRLAPRQRASANQQLGPRVKRSSNATVGAAPTGRRHKRQSVPPPPKIEKGSKHLVDSCESKIELVTPYWAANSAGKIRAVVNTKHFPQAIHQEICKGTTTSHCGGSCMCEQKYTFHRLLAYDPDNDCKGIFIDWFLFPSCCACRCPP
ncbi:protein spaetzle 3-like isoform X1 [Pollicipes pollicipes]|uniref:protein spaetzle 3-like isoform X1 n=1 Tax=Pollicipes pollicipes TaxID=41117 RepID=UPI001884C417|nr:protein spaetzle 3-like isoform X1 [Pollicipes pollicipes]